MLGLTAADQSIDQRLFALEQELFKNFMPVIPDKDKLIFKKIDKRSLISLASSVL